MTLTANRLRLTRRDVIRGIGASALFAVARRRAYAAEYHQADTSWLADCRFGVSTHWTAASQPVGTDDWVAIRGSCVPFQPVEAMLTRLPGRVRNMSSSPRRMPCKCCLHRALRSTELRPDGRQNAILSES